MNRDPGIVCQVDRRERGSTVHTREPAGIAMREDLDGRPARGLSDECETMSPMRPALFHVLIAEPGGLAKCGVRALRERPTEASARRILRQRPGEIVAPSGALP